MEKNIHFHYIKKNDKMQVFFSKNQRYLDKKEKKFYNRKKRFHGGFL